MTLGISAYGAYVPRYRIRVEEIARVWGDDADDLKNGLMITEKSVPDTVIAVPPAGGPDRTSIEKMIRCENSDVFPLGSVAVAEIRTPSSVATGSVTSIEAWPEPSVVACDEPR